MIIQLERQNNLLSNKRYSDFMLAPARFIFYPLWYSLSKTPNTAILLYIIMSDSEEDPYSHMMLFLFSGNINFILQNERFSYQ